MMITQRAGGGHCRRGQRTAGPKRPRRQGNDKALSAGLLAAGRVFSGGI